MSCFLNRDKDFEDEDVVGELSGLGCELFFDFDAGYRFIVDRASCKIGEPSGFFT